ncbi:hypothetical protein EDC02_5226 [Micromonospora sp. Llam0]|uniref:hypothetical protein n=1 Tax=Micromonospora sp. Llam0 TaxID=2485143 RepID=UPI000F4923F2|nr:hypothetical protein [Micromonospora sp. Llam0]ROO63206.1 hypothetical protein EDC02_5226 [Micromonospora sp. Llam0]
MSETRVEPEELRRVAKAIGSIMDDYDAVFRNLGSMDPNAGKFDVAEWLEDLFADRRDAIVTHAKYLRMAFEEINAGLYRVADAFEGVDMSNGDAVAAATGVARTAIEDMNDAEFVPTEVQSKDDYDTGDDEDLGDEKTYSIEDGEATVEFDPDQIHGMSDELEVDDLGKDDDEEIDLGEGDAIEDAEDGLTFENDDEDEEEEDEDEEEDDGDGGGDRPSTGEHFKPVEPSADDYEYEEKDFQGNTYRTYYVGGDLQEDEDGEQIYWLNNKPYIFYNNHQRSRMVEWTE